MAPLKSTSGGHFTHPSKGVMPNVSPRPTQEYHGRIQVGDTLLPGYFTTNFVHDESLAAARQVLVGTTFLEDMLKATKEEDMYAHLEQYITAVVSAVHAHQKTGQRHTESAKFGCDAPLMDERRPDSSTFAREDLLDRFRCSLARWELKISSDNGPSSNEAQKPNADIAHVADAVRLRAGSRPYQPFTPAVIIGGEFFWGSMWDQAGVVVSHRYTVKDEEDLFLRLILSVHCNMDVYDYRQNSGTRFSRNFDFVPLASNGGANGSLNTACALNTISDVRSDDLCGEAFRASSSNTELLGLRLARVAKTIYQYDTELELLRGARDILQGLMAMNHVGWAHRDVSASNCLLSCDPADGPSVVLDMELAQKTENQASASKTAISGSMQFMARTLLKTFYNKNNQFARELHYDLESFIYVLVFAVMRKEYTELSGIGNQKAECIKAFFVRAFGQSAPSHIEGARAGLAVQWTEYTSTSTGDRAHPAVLHHALGALLNVAQKQTVGEFKGLFSEDAGGVITLLDGKKVRSILKQAIQIQKDRLEDTSPDSDDDLLYDD